MKQREVTRIIFPDSVTFYHKEKKFETSNKFFNWNNLYTSSWKEITTRNNWSSWLS